MRPLRFPIGGIVAAAMLAGPIFLLWIAAMLYYGQLPNAVPVSFDWNDVSGLALLGLLAALVGFVLAIVPVLLGSAVMVWAGTRLPALRAGPAWTTAGAAAPLALGLALAWPDALTLALTATGATCAAICRRGARARR